MSKQGRGKRQKPVLRLDPGPEGSMKETLRAAARVGAPQALTTAALRHLEHECGSIDSAVKFLADLATESGKPIFINLPAELPGETITQAIAPRGWSNERLQGWIAGRHEELADEFGDIKWVAREPEDPATSA